MLDSVTSKGVGRKQPGSSQPGPLLPLLLLGTLAGCQLEYLSEGLSPHGELTGGYDEAVLRQSTRPEVLRILDVQAGRLGADGRSAGQFHQGQNCVAVSGESRDGSERWFTLFVFDEGSQMTRRKYRFYLDEQAGLAAGGSPFALSNGGGRLIFEGDMVLSHDFGAYGRSAYGRDIATFRYIASRLHFDCKKLAAGGGATRSHESNLAVSGMLMNQVFRAALLELEGSPQLAANLATAEGMAFEHLTLDHGRAFLTVQGDVANVRVEVGLPIVEPDANGEFAAFFKSLL